MSSDNLGRGAFLLISLISFNTAYSAFAKGDTGQSITILALAILAYGHSSMPAFYRQIFDRKEIRALSISKKEMTPIYVAMVLVVIGGFVQFLLPAL